jgi:hypothetical protein
MPHVSPTKFTASTKKYLAKHHKLFASYATKRIDSVQSVSTEEVKATSILNWRMKSIDAINRARRIWKSGLRNNYELIDCTFSQVKEAKMGNCGEDAVLSAAILKMNGKTNACVADLSADCQMLDHCVCVFNRDGKPFSGRINKDTIIVDSWLGVTDFAQNMFLKYKNIFNEKIGLRENNKLRLDNVRQLQITDEQLECLRKDYPQFLHKVDFYK